MAGVATAARKTSHVYSYGLKKWAPGLVNFDPAIPYLSITLFIPFFSLVPQLGQRKILATQGPIISPALYIHDIRRGMREGGSTVTGMGRKLFCGRVCELAGEGSQTS